MHGWRMERGREDSIFSLVFPTYNPGPRIDTIWSEVRQFLDRSPGWEALFVCDGCTDGTPERLAVLADAEPCRARILSYASNQGKGHAVRLGLAEARGRWRLFTDVDLAYSFAEVERVAAVLQAGAEVAIASRTHPDSRLVLPPQLQGYAYRRHLQSLVFSLVARGLLPITQRDTQAGLKGMSARAAGLILPHLRCAGFGFDCELLTACARLGLRVAEVPVWVRYEDRASTTGLGSMSRMLRELWRIRRTWRKLPSPVPAVQSPQKEAA